MLLARVAVPVPLGLAFTYRVGPELASRCRPGARVVCEFGRRRAVAVVLDCSDREPELEVDKLKFVLAVVDPEPVFPEELLSFLLELSRYYLAPVGEVMRLALPAVERGGAEQQELLTTGTKLLGRRVQLLSAISDPPVPLPALKPRVQELYEHVRTAGPTTLSLLEERWSTARPLAKKLVELGLCELTTQLRASDPFFAAAVERDAPPSLTEAQSAAVTTLCQSLEQRERKGYLLHGVTASGKTEVYLHAAKRCLDLGRGVLVLVPEIALTPQLVSRFRARLGDDIAVVHSELSELERHGMWKRLRSGELRVAVGARSALFAPIAELGLICVDEEHDGSYKQEEGVRYHARDMALLRAFRAGAVAVLGTATPSLATEQLTRNGQLTRLRLPGRARAAAAMPSVELVDLRRMGRGPTGDRLVTLPLIRALEATLRAGEQAILFLNRRGFAPSLLCDDCGHIVRCPDCSVALTVHRARGQRMVCHYCDYSMELPSQCPDCKATQLSEEGSGTERIEAALAKAFPSARIGRLDRDVAAGAKSAVVLDKMRAGLLDILVGTQMVTKGHDLPMVTLVGVLDADSALSIPDFRAAERTFQLLVQVAGRAGRAERPGRVLVQTRQPEAPAIGYAMAHDVEGFVSAELVERESLFYPPFSRLALVRCESVDERLAEQTCARFAEQVRREGRGKLEILGPAAAPLARLRNRYRFRFLIKASERVTLRSALLGVLRAGCDRRVRLIVDIDPQNML